MEEEEGPVEALIRATLLVTFEGGAPRILSGHLSEFPSEGECGCGGGCCEGEE